MVDIRLYGFYAMENVLKVAEYGMYYLRLKKK